MITTLLMKVAFITDLNVEHLQLLASLFVNFSKDCKVQLIKQCISAIKSISIELSNDYPLRAYRLMIILDYMLKAFSVVPHKLFEQVNIIANSILNIYGIQLCRYM